MRILILFFAGMFLWTFLEYMIHRFLGHWHFTKNKFYVEHKKHHSQKNYFAPLREKLRVAGIFVIAELPLSMLIFGSVSGFAFTLGTMTCYFIYEWLHYRIHVYPPILNNWYGFHLRKHHFSHHYNSPSDNHGVTSCLWDVLFRTRLTYPTVRVPRQMGHDWIFDSNNKDVRSVYKRYFK